MNGSEDELFPRKSFASRTCRAAVLYSLAAALLLNGVAVRAQPSDYASASGGTVTDSVYQSVYSPAPAIPIPVPTPPAQPAPPTPSVPPADTVQQSVYSPPGKPGTVSKTVYASVSEAVYADRVFDFTFLDGKPTDMSSARQHGKIIGDVAIEYDLAVKKQVASFNGRNNNFIQIPFSLEQRNKVAKQFTLEAAFKMNKIADMGILMNTQGGGIGFESTETGFMELWAHIGGSYQRVGVQLEKEQYYHLAAAYDGSQISLYLDGRLVKSVDASGDVLQPDMNFSIGGDPGAHDSAGVVLDGSVSIARLYDKGLGADDIRKLYEEHAARSKLEGMDDLAKKKVQLQALLGSNPAEELRQLMADIEALNARMSATAPEVAELLVRCDTVLGKYQKNKLVFAVWSDVHINDYESVQDTKFQKALTTVNQLAPDLKAYIMAGDLTNTGTHEQYDRFNRTYDQYALSNVKKLYVMGNHDYWNGLSPEEAQKRFTAKLGVPLHSHEIIDGYHFIQVSPENGTTNGDYKTVKTWLKQELAKAQNDAPDKPIFVTFHQHATGTVYGSDDWGNPDLVDVLKEYPQVITFSGHSHYAINDERSIHQKDFTSIGTASLSYLELESGKLGGSIPSDAIRFSQGMLVEVDKTTQTVRVKRLDFHNNQIIKDDWIIEKPGDKNAFRYTDQRAAQSVQPYFEEQAAAAVSDIKENTVKLTFDQGRDEDLVHSYKIQAVNQATGKIDTEFLIFSDFYAYPRAEKLSTSVSGLKDNTEYVFSVTAIDSWGKQSAKPLRVSAKTLDRIDVEEGTDIPGELAWAAKIDRAPALDGSLDDGVWTIDKPIRYLKKDDPARDNKASYGLLWDKEHLYVGIDITDSKLVEKGLWFGDEVSVFIDGNHDKKDRYEVPYDVQIGLGYAEDGSTKVFGFGGGASGRKAEDIRKAIRKTDKGWSVEMAIPWAFLGIDPDVQRQIGFDVAVDDNDGTDAFDSTLYWSKSELPDAWKNTSGFGTVALYSKEKPAADVFDYNFMDGKATDSSPWKHHGETAGDVKFEYDPAVKKHVAVFNGQNDHYIKIPFSKEQRDKVTKQFTLETVFKMNKIADMGILMNTQSGGIGFESTDSGFMELWAHIGGSYKRVGVQVEKDQYYHLAATYDGSTIQLYLDGALVNSLDASGDVYHPDIHFALPGDPYPGGAGAVLDGRVALGRLYSRALSVSEVKKVYAEYATRKSQTQVDQLLEMQKKMTEWLVSHDSETVKQLYAESERLYSRMNVSAAEIESLLKRCADAMGQSQPINHAPVFRKVESQRVQEGYKLTFQMIADDSDDDPLTYSAENLPSGAAFDTGTGTFSWIPGMNQAGMYKVLFKVSDGVNTAQAEVAIQVVDVPIVVDDSGSSDDSPPVTPPAAPAKSEPSAPPVKETAPPVAQQPKPSAPPAATNHPFKDLVGYDWAEQAVTGLAAKGLFAGTTGTSFEPGKSVSRADFLVMLVKILGLSASFDSNFADVNPNDPYYQALGIARKLGISEGVGGNRFDPQGEITRQDMMVLAARAMTAAGKLTAGGKAGDLSDWADSAQVADYAAAGIASLIGKGIIEGSGNAIHPQDMATRADAAVMLYRMISQ